MSQKYKLQKLVAERRHPNPKTAKSLIQLFKSNDDSITGEICCFFCAPDGSENHAYAQVMAMVPELVEALQKTTIKAESYAGHVGTELYYSGNSLARDIKNARALLAKVNQYFKG